MKILSASQIRALDAYTIESEGISSLDLMERASITFTKWFVELFPDTERTISIFCGIGNNAGDGFAIARLLYQRAYPVKIFWCKISDQISPDCQANYERLPPRNVIPVHVINPEEELPIIPPDSLIIDGIFGSGLNRPVTGYWATLIQHINESDSTIVSIDVPSGLFIDQATSSMTIQADYCLSFELPKLGFLFPENYQSARHWEYRSIGLLQEFIQQIKTIHNYIDAAMITKTLKDRSKYAHKGNFGHALMILGSQGKIGAAILATEACLRVGVGLLTVHAPACGYIPLQTRIPEAMISVDEHQHCFSKMPPINSYQAIGIGCGLSTASPSVMAFDELLIHANQTLIIDADALNIIARRKWHFKIPRNSIITPHPKEFERLFGPSNNEFERNELQRNKAQELNIFIILKGAHTCIACPDGQCYFNSTGNPGMATAGSGDVLTGILTGLLAQGYSPKETAILGVYLHGLAGDIALADISSPEALLAGDIVATLGKAFAEIRVT